MKCKRCDANVPDFLWKDDDHPVLTDHPIVVSRDDIIEQNQVKITATTWVTYQMCSDVYPDKKEAILELDVSVDIEDAVMRAMGAASMCWENLEGAGVFESERCKTIGEELIAYFMSKGPIY